MKEKQNAGSTAVPAAAEKIQNLPDARSKACVLEFIGDTYHRTAVQIELENFRPVRGAAPRSALELGDDYFRSRDSLIHLIDARLAECSEDTRLIIRKDFLESGTAGWWHKYYTKSAYHYRRKRAIDEFIRRLDI